MALTRRSGPAIVVSPAARFYLMLGGEATVWLPGWVEWAQDPRSSAEIRREVWPLVADQCFAEARGFLPWGATGRKPRGPAVDRWARAFLARYPRPPAIAPSTGSREGGP